LEPEPPPPGSEPAEPTTPPSSPQIILIGEASTPSEDSTPSEEFPPAYRPDRAHPTPALEQLLLLRGVNPLYGLYLVNSLGIADRNERIQALESILELPWSLGPAIRVPPQDELPPGPLATLRLDTQLLQLGLATPAELSAADQPDEEDRDRMFAEERVWVLALADKLRRLFDHQFPDVHDVRTTPVWVAGELLEFGGDFNKYITSHRLQKHEGVVFRHLLRLILLIGEFIPLCPPDTTEEEWQAELSEIRETLVDCCRTVDPMSTDKMLEEEQKEANATE